MKQSMVDFMNTICDKDFKSLKKIINHKFRKFRSFYWLLKDYSKNIEQVYYDDDTDLSLLSISIIPSDISTDDLAHILLSNIEEGQPIEISYDDKSLYINIYGEEELPLEVDEDEDETDEDSPENK